MLRIIDNFLLNLLDSFFEINIVNNLLILKEDIMLVVLVKFVCYFWDKKLIFCVMMINVILWIK